ncbi:MAG: alpha-galactosidase [bacterium]|nr:alpha-galactosidase [bacterium]
MQPEKSTFDSCYAECTGDSLTLGNPHIERTWRIQNGLLFATSLRNLHTGTEWIAAPAEEPAPVPAMPLPDEPRTLHLSTKTGANLPVEAPSLRASLRAEGERLTLSYHFQIFSNAAAITTQLDIEWHGAEPLPLTALPQQGANHTHLTAEDTAPKTDADATDLAENLLLSPTHLRLLQVDFVARTDFHNELVFEHEWLLHTSENNLALRGNLFAFENTLTQNGLILLKHAPQPNARPVRTHSDLTVQGKNRNLTLFGHDMDREVLQGYPHTLLLYQNGEVGRTQILHHFQRQLRTYQPGRDGTFLSNTWGDRSQDSRINDPFMQKEILAGATMGVDVVQIDDGWQNGRSSNSVKSGGIRQGFWEANPNFWAPHPERFPNGFEDLVRKAAEKGMQFGLWFWPDNSNHLENWKRDADALITLHRTHHINYFKIDGVTFTSRRGEQNLQSFFHRILHESDGRIVLDLDITAGLRPGYFGAMHTGPLFVENRYTDWCRYWPHHTLRNIWKLSHYVDPLRLRMEFLNHTRNADLYTDDPLAPQHHRPDYLFATTLMVNPLGWFEVSNLPPGYIDTVAPVVQTWKIHRDAFFSGTIHPIGSPPDGTTWTGFASVSPGETSGYLLLFREYNNRPTWTTHLPLFTNKTFTIEPLAGRGTATLANHELTATIDTPQDFLFAHLKQKP